MKKILALLLAAVLVLMLAGCHQTVSVIPATDGHNMSMNDIIANAPSIVGTIRKAGDTYILIENEQGEYRVSLQVQCADSMMHFSVGDEVTVYYDGSIAETYPMKINTVYAITLRTPADRAENNKS